MKKYIILSAFLCCSPAVFAATANYSIYVDQTTYGIDQSISVNLSGLETFSGSGGILSVSAYGDYSHISVVPNETISVSVESLFLTGDMGGIIVDYPSTSTILDYGPAGSYDELISFNHSTVEFTKLFSLDQALLNAIIADGVAYFDVNIGSGVSSPGWFELSLSYDAASPVPLPASAWLFGTAILGLLRLKR